jgi:hypothetical protein
MAWVKLGGNSGPIQKWTATGQELEGIFLGLRNGKEFRQGQGPSKLADLRKDDGTQVTCGAPTALASQLSQVQPGTRVKIRYLGLTRGQGGVEYKNFETEAQVSEGGPSQPAQVQQPQQPVQQQPAQQPVQHTFESLKAVLVKAKGADAGNAIADAIKSMEGDPVERLKKTLTAQGIQF